MLKVNSKLKQDLSETIFIHFYKLWRAVLELDSQQSPFIVRSSIYKFFDV
jgi:hypothetical protein